MVSGPFMSAVTTMRWAPEGSCAGTGGTGADGTGAGDDADEITGGRDGEVEDPVTGTTSRDAQPVTATSAAATPTTSTQIRTLL